MMSVETRFFIGVQIPDVGADGICYGYRNGYTRLTSDEIKEILSPEMLAEVLTPEMKKALVD